MSQFDHGSSSVVLENRFAAPGVFADGGCVAAPLLVGVRSAAIVAPIFDVGRRFSFRRVGAPARSESETPLSQEKSLKKQ
jgi:hypothetical protein